MKRIIPMVQLVGIVACVLVSVSHAMLRHLDFAAAWWALAAGIMANIRLDHLLDRLETKK